MTREQRPAQGLDEKQAAAWDSYDQMWDRFERIADELRPPPGYKIDPDEWRDCLLDCLLTCGCDWLEWFIARQSFVTVGEAVVQCIDRLSMEKQG